MGKKSLRLDEEIHDIIEEIQTERQRKKGVKPSKEKLVEEGIEELFPEEQRGKKKSSEFDELFSL